MEKGTYFSASGTDRDSTFQLVDRVAVYGGFAGTETSLSERDWAANVTVLSGDIGTAVESDNSYHAVTGNGTNVTAVLDGFTITEGYANGSGQDETGGGLIDISGSPTETSHGTRL